MLNRGRPSKRKEMQKAIMEIISLPPKIWTVTTLTDELKKRGYKTSRRSVDRAVLELLVVNRIKTASVTKSKDKRYFRTFRTA